MCMLNKGELLKLLCTLYIYSNDAVTIVIYFLIILKILIKYSSQKYFIEKHNFYVYGIVYSALPYDSVKASPPHSKLTYG